MQRPPAVRLALSAAVIVALASPVLAEQSPAGLWQADGFGAVIDFHVEPADARGMHSVVGVVHAPAGMQCHGRESPAILRLCERAEKDGPFVILGAFENRSASPLVGDFRGAFEVPELVDDLPLRLVMVGDSIARLEHSVTAGGADVALSVSARLVDPKPTPDARWAAGNWVAAFETVRIEAAIAATPPVGLDGTIAVHTVRGGLQRSTSNMVDNFGKLAEDHQSFAMRFEAALGQTGLFFEGPLATGPEYTAIFQESVLRLLPFEGVGLVAQFRELDRTTFSPPFLMLALDGPLTPVAPPGTTSSAVDPAPAPAKVDPAAAGHPWGEILGEWRIVSVHSGSTMAGMRELGGFLPGTVSVVADGAAARIDIEWQGPDRRGESVRLDYPGADAERIIGLLPRLGAMPGLGTITEWLGGDRFSIFGLGVDEGFMTVGDRAVMVLELDGYPAPLFMLSSFGSVEYAAIVLLENVSRPTARGPVTADPPERPRDPPQGGRPPAAGDGVLALLDATGSGDPCAALMGFERALWAGAADGSVDLRQLRAMSIFMYPLGVADMGLVNQAHCQSVLAMLRAEAQRLSAR